MDQITHTWIAVRAVALLEDEGEVKGLVGLLKPQVREASVGAWLPDRADARISATVRDNHVFEILPFKKVSRFIVSKRRLLDDHVGSHRMIYRLLDDDKTLTASWWNTAYKAEARPGQHLTNRAMAVATALRDLLLLGNKKIDELLPGRLKSLKYVIDECRTEEETAAMFFFILSHFMADAAMPCHCDGRDLARAKGKLHSQLERHWGRLIPDTFDDNNLLRASPRRGPTAVLNAARSLDADLGITFAPNVPDLRPDHDIWLETVYLCRASFSLCSIIAHPDTYPYKSKKLPRYSTVLGSGNPDLGRTVDQVCLHDAVVNTAVAWKHVWSKAATPH